VRPRRKELLEQVGRLLFPRITVRPPAEPVEGAAAAITVVVAAVVQQPLLPNFQTAHHAWVPFQARPGCGMAVVVVMPTFRINRGRKPFPTIGE
jgi:hypothetical protein